MTDFTLVRSAAPSRRSAVRELAAALIASAVLVFDPFGWAPFGPLKWAVISCLSVAVAASTWVRSVSYHRASIIAWVAFLIWTAICAATGLDPLYSWIGTPDRHLGWLTFVLFGLIFVAGQNLSGHLRLLARTVTVTTIGVTGYCIAELAGLAPVDLAVESTRAGGPFGSPAYLGAACVLLLPISAALAADPDEKDPWRRTALVALVGGVFAAIASQTRGAWLGVLASALITCRWWWPLVRRRWWILAAAALILMFASPIIPRATDAVQGDFAARIDEWRMGVAVVADHPWLGVGPEGYRLAFPLVVDADYERLYTRQTTPDRAHNGLIDITASFGLLGLVAYAAAGVFLIRRSWAAVGGQSVLMAGVGAAIVGYLVQQQFLFSLAEVDIIFWLLAGVLVASTGNLKVVRPSKLVPVLLAVVSVVALAAGTLDVFADHQVLASRRRPDFATNAADRATALRPDSIRYWLVSADAHTRVGDLGGATERIDKALAISPLDPILLAARGQILLGVADTTRSQADIDRVVAFYRQLLAADPNNGQNQLRAGTAFALAGDLEAAADAFLTAADLAPTSAVPFANLARVYLASGDIEKAVDAFRRARSIDPDSPGLDEIAALLQSPEANIG